MDSIFSVQQLVIYSLLQTMILILVLILKRHKGFHNLYLLLFLGSVLLYFSLVFIELIMLPGADSWIQLVRNIIDLLPAPFLYLYSLSLICDFTTKVRISVKVFLPIIVLSLLSVPLLYFGYKGDSLSNGYIVYMDIFRILLFISIPVQSIVLALLVLRRVKKKCGFSGSSIVGLIRMKEPQYSWIKTFIVFFTMHATVNIGVLVIYYINEELYLWMVNYANTFVVLFVSFTLTLLFFLNPYVLHINKEKTNHKDIRKYEKSNTNRTEAMEFMKKMNRYMETARPYLNKDLSINHLAQELDTTSHYISEVINGVIGQNFFDYVNNYRIEEFKKLISDKRYDHYKISALAYEAGFSSRTTFFNAFKKFTGITPSEYKAELKS